jgi:GxxExxY protein
MAGVTTGRPPTMMATMSLFQKPSENPAAPIKRFQLRKRDCATVNPLAVLNKPPADDEESESDEKLSVAAEAQRVMLAVHCEQLADEVLLKLGAGHTESVYHNALKAAMQIARLQYESERDLPISYEGFYVGTVRADLIVEKRLVIELKAATSGGDALLSDAEAQCRRYMSETRIPNGLVIVFPKRPGKPVQVRHI